MPTSQSCSESNCATSDLELRELFESERLRLRLNLLICKSYKTVINFAGPPETSTSFKVSTLPNGPSCSDSNCATSIMEIRESFYNITLANVQYRINKHQHFSIYLPQKPLNPPEYQQYPMVSLVVGMIFAPLLCIQLYFEFRSTAYLLYKIPCKVFISEKDQVDGSSVHSLAMFLPIIT